MSDGHLAFWLSEISSGRSPSVLSTPAVGASSDQQLRLPCSTSEMRYGGSLGHLLQFAILGVIADAYRLGHPDISVQRFRRITVVLIRDRSSGVHVC